MSMSALWRFALSPGLTQRIQPGWSWQSHFIGSNTYPDSLTGEFPEKDTIGNYERLIKIIPTGQESSGVKLQDSYLVRDEALKKVVWEYIFEAMVDPKTGAHLNKNYSDEYFVFPREVEKKTYKLRYSYLKGIPVAFQREEQIEGVNTYLFSYKGRGEYTESYLGTDEYPGIEVKPGQEIKCRDDQFLFDVWVEPVTGEVIKLDESCYSGDYVYDIASGKAIQAVSRWGGVTAGDNVIQRAAEVLEARTKYQVTNLYVPLILLVGGLAFLGVGLYSRKRLDA
jgi:hypothetical protein